MLNTQTFKKLTAAIGLAAAAFALVAGTAQSGHAQTPPLGNLSQVAFPNWNPGNLKMYQYNRVSPWPHNGAKRLVVVLHGCLQTAAQYASESGWMEVAEDRGFHLIFAEQKLTNNPARCFNWFKPEDVTRGYGEGMSIIGMIQKVHELNPGKVYSPGIYVTGLSAGGAMAAAVTAAYPEVFAGLAVNAGVPVGCGATNSAEGMDCMAAPPSTKSSEVWGNAVRSSHPFGDAARKPAVIIFHGTDDDTVKPARMTELMQQWTNNNRMLEVPTSTAPLKGHPSNLYSTSNPAYSAGHNEVRTVSITDMRHAVAVDPASTPRMVDQCGKVGQYAADPSQPPATTLMGAFFPQPAPAGSTPEALCSSYYTADFWNL